MRWQHYLRLAYGQAQDSCAPFLCMRLVNPWDISRHPVFLDAKLDTGSGVCGVPSSTVQFFRGRKQRLLEGRPRRIRGPFDGELSHRPSYRFHVDIFPLSRSVVEYSSDELQRITRRLAPLYQSNDHIPMGLEMTPVATEYALIGRNVLASWTVILCGTLERHKVLARCPRWLLIRLGPAAEDAALRWSRDKAERARRYC